MGLFDLLLGKRSGGDVPSLEEASALAQSRKDVHLIDVRTKEEYKKGHLPGAVNVCVNDMAQKIDSVVPNKEETIYVYCQSGSRSRIAQRLLLDRGYKKVENVGGVMFYRGTLV